MWRTAITAAGFLLAAAPAGAQAAGSCTGPAFRQFDFFEGDWDTYDLSDTTRVIARNLVTRILGDCVLREAYEQKDGLVGESYSLYDAGRRVWHQSWVTNRGGLLLLDGGLEGARMVLTGTEHRVDGTASLMRAIWWAEGPNVREKAERSTDGGKTWVPVFDIVFRRHSEK